MILFLLSLKILVARCTRYNLSNLIETQKGRSTSSLDMASEEDELERETKRLISNHGKDALMWVIQESRQEVAELLIKKGADIHAKRNDGRNALMYAIEYYRKEVAELLIEKGADIHAKSNSGRNALMYACREGLKEVAELLIEKGVDIHAIDNGGRNALMYTCREGLKGVAELLIERGIDIHAKSNSSRNALMYVCREGLKEAAELLIEKGIDINDVDEDGRNSLMYSSDNGKKEVAELLIEKGVDINAKRKDGRNALMVARDREVAELLIDKGVDINAKSNDGMNALMYASGDGRKEVAEVLIERGVGVNAKSEYGMNALMYAGTKEVAEVLIEKGVDINAKSRDGMNALMYACEKGLKEVAELLIDRGANIHAKSNDGMNALMYVASYRSKGLPMLLIGRGCQINDDAYDEVLKCRNDHEGAKVGLEYLDTGIDINKYYPKLSVDFLVKNAEILAESNNKRYGAWHFGVMNPEVKILEEILEEDELLERINEKDKKGFSALKLCTSMEGKEEHVRLLISRGACPKVISAARRNENFSENDLLYIKEYISKEMIIDLLKKDKLAIASKVIFGYMEEKELETKKGVKIVRSAWNQEYKDKIEIGVRDREGKNILHHLALCKEREDMEEFVNKMMYIRIIEKLEQEAEQGKDRRELIGEEKEEIKKWILEYDNEGLMPIHYAIEADNCEYIGAIKRKLEELGIEIKEEEIKTKKGEKLEKYIEDRTVSSRLRKELNKWFNYVDKKELEKEIERLRMKATETEAEFVGIKRTLEQHVKVTEELRAKIAEVDNKSIIEAGLEGIKRTFESYFNVNEELRGKIKKLENKGISDLVGVSRTFESHFNAIEEARTKASKSEMEIEAMKRTFQSYFNADEEMRARISKLEKKQLAEEEKKLSSIESKLQKTEELSKEEGKIKDLKDRNEKNELKEEEKEKELVEAINLGMRELASEIWKVIREEKTRELVREKLSMEKICKAGNSEVLKLVVDIKGSAECLKERDRRANTLLHMAASRGYEQVVEILLEYQEVLELLFEKNKNGRTVVHSAVKGGSIRVLELISHKLIELGRKDLIEEIDNRGSKALDLALGMKKHNNAKRAIREGMIYGLLCLGEGIEYDPENYKSAIHMAFDLKRDDLVLELAMGNMNEMNEGKTIIHRVVEEGMMNVLEEITRMIMVEENYRELIQKKDKEGRPILELIKIEKGIEIARMLFKKAMICGIRSEELVNEKNAEGEIPLLSLVKRGKEEKIEWEEMKAILKYLIDNGSDRKEESKEEVNTIEEVEDKYGKEEAKELEEYEPDYGEKEERERKHEEAKRVSEEEKRKREEDMNKVMGVMKEELDFREEILSDGKKVIHFLIERDDRLAVKELLDRGAKGNDKVLILDEDGRMLGERENAYKIAFRLKRYKIMEMMLERDESNVSLCKQFKEVVKEGKIDKDELQKFEKDAQLKGLL